MSDFLENRATWGLCNISGLHPAEYERLFEPSPGEVPVETLAYCGECALSQSCKAYASEHDLQDGVWGGENFATKIPTESKVKSVQENTTQTSSSLEPHPAFIERVEREGGCMTSGLSRTALYQSFIHCSGRRTTRALALCSRCLLQDECLIDAYERSVRYGVQGGESAPKRLESIGKVPKPGGRNIVDIILQRRSATTHDN